jgi:hypothetical protein
VPLSSITASVVPEQRLLSSRIESGAVAAHFRASTATNLINSSIGRSEDTLTNSSTNTRGIQRAVVQPFVSLNGSTDAAAERSRYVTRGSSGHLRRHKRLRPDGASVSSTPAVSKSNVRLSLNELEALLDSEDVPTDNATWEDTDANPSDARAGGADVPGPSAPPPLHSPLSNPVEVEAGRFQLSAPVSREAVGQAQPLFPGDSGDRGPEVTRQPVGGGDHSDSDEDVKALR